MKSFQKHAVKERHLGRHHNATADDTAFSDSDGSISYAERGCTKKRHRTYKKAMNHIRVLVEFGEAKRGEMTVYICPECHFFHVAHKR